MWELAGEKWRHLVEGHITGSDEDMQFFDDHILEISQRFSIHPDELKSNILNALNTGKAPVTPAMLALRAPIVDLHQVLSEFGRIYDIEGLVIKASEVIFNTLPEHRNTQRPSSTWRDAQELISLYGPLLEFLGFEDLAALSYGTAYEYLYKNSRYLPTAQDIKARADFAWRSGLREKVFNGLQALSGVQVINGRVKHVGSIVRKIEDDRGTPDVIGLRVQIDEPKSVGVLEKHIWTHIDSITKSMRSQGFEIGDLRGKNPIEVRWNGVASKGGRIRRADGRWLNYELTGPTIDGYEGIHLNFYKVDDPDVGLEVQVFTPSQDLKRRGISAHGFYKSGKAVGELGEARREYEEVVSKGLTGLEASIKRRNYFTLRSHLLSYLRQFKGRTDRFAGPANDFRLWLNRGSADILVEEFISHFAELEQPLIEVCPGFWGESDDEIYAEV
jgi:hypothetical protein